MGSSKPYRTTAILCSLMLGSGIAISAVLYCFIVKLEKTLMKKISGFDASSAPVLEMNARVWTVGLLYIIPAVIGFISACSKSKGCYIAHMVIEIIALVIGGFLFVGGILLLFTGAQDNYDIDGCESVGDTCVCSSSLRTFSQDCASVRSLLGYLYGLAACFVIGWIICLIDTIHSGMVACRSTPSTGAVIIGSQPATTTIVTGVNMGAYPPGPYPYSPAPAPPQYDSSVGGAYSTSDTAVLVKNGE